MSPGRGRDQVPLGSNPFAVADQACNFPLLGIFSDFLQKTLQIHACDSRVRIRLIQPLQHPRWVRLGQVRFRFCIIRHLCGQFFVLSVSVGLVFALARAAGKTSMAISRTGVRASAGSGATSMVISRTGVCACASSRNSFNSYQVCFEKIGSDPLIFVSWHLFLRYKDVYI